MSGIGSFFTSAFTRPGTNARNAQQDEFNKAGGYSFGLLGPYADYIKQNIPRMSNVTSNLYNYTTQGGRDSLVNSYWQNALGQARQQMGNAGTQFSGNPALGQAYGLGAMNDANTSAGQYSRQLNSPQGQLGAYESYLGSMGAMNPAISGLSSLTNNVYHIPLQPVGAGLGDYLGAAIGPALGKYFAPGAGKPSTTDPGMSAPSGSDYTSPNPIPPPGWNPWSANEMQGTGGDYAGQGAVGGPWGAYMGGNP